MSEDAELLRQYAQSGSETAFAELVGRYLPLVYATALRQGNGDEALAKDVAQTVFIDLARKASSLLGRELLAGWLYTSTRLAASKAVRGEQRRQLREQIAASMQEHTTPPESQADQNELKLVLDEAMSELDADERNAVLIRFFQGKELKEVGSALGISEDAARMRITRALDRLHGLLSQRGVTLSVTALGTALAAQAAAAVPSGLAASIAATALAGAASSTSTLTLIKGALKLTAWTKAKTAVVAGVVLLLAVGIMIIKAKKIEEHILPANSISYSIRGTLSYESHGMSEPAGLKKAPDEREFEVLVNGSNWSVKMVLVGDTNYSYFLTTYDGSNVVYASRLNAEARQRLTPKTKGPLFASCEVEPSPVPGWIGNVADNYAWLAFASGCYFKALTNGAALDFHRLATPYGLFMARRVLPSRIELFPAPPYLPIQVDYLWTNRAAMANNGKVINWDLPAPFRRGFLAAELKSEGFTNVGGWSFPTKFEVKEYAPLPTATNENDFRCMVIVRGSVTAISTAPQKWSNELAGETFHVIDRRFPNSPTYFITNGVLPAPGDPMLALAQERAAREVNRIKDSRVTAF